VVVNLELLLLEGGKPESEYNVLQWQWRQLCKSEKNEVVTITLQTSLLHHWSVGALRHWSDRAPSL